MVEVRLAREGEIVSQKELWKLSFGDQDSYIDFYFANRYKEDETLLLVHNGEIISMLTMIATKTVLPDNRSFDSAMLYAIATHLKYRNQGFGAQLMDFSHTYLAAQNRSFSILVPAERRVVNFYYKQGYTEAFYLREVSFSYERVESMKISRSYLCTISPLEPKEYNARRNDLLKGKFYIAYPDEQIQYQKKLSQQSGADVYAIDFEGISGCAVVERITSDKVLIKEMLIPEEFFHLVIREIIYLIPATEYILRTPAYLGENLGGTIRPFGLIKAHGEFDIEMTSKDGGYLGIAFD